MAVVYQDLIDDMLELHGARDGYLNIACTCISVACQAFPAIRAGQQVPLPPIRVNDSGVRRPTI